MFCILPHTLDRSTISMTRLTQVPPDATPGSSWFRTLASKEDYARAEALDRLCERLYGKSLQVFGETTSGESASPFAQLRQLTSRPRLHPADQHRGCGRGPARRLRHIQHDAQVEELAPGRREAARQEPWRARRPAHGKEPARGPARTYLEGRGVWRGGAEARWSGLAADRPIATRGPAGPIFSYLVE